MSKASIDYNNQAIKYLYDAIEKYEKSLETMESGNDNDKFTDLKTKFELEMKNLEDIVGLISTLSANISQAMKERDERLAAEEAARLEAEAAAAAAAAEAAKANAYRASVSKPSTTTSETTTKPSFLNNKKLNQLQ